MGSVPPAKSPHSPPPQAAGQPERFSLTDGGRGQLTPQLLARQASLDSPGQPAFALVLNTLEHLCGIAYLDLGPHFRQRAAAGEALFGEVDVHPNARGYAFIAAVVLAHLQEHAARYGLD